VSDIDTAVVDGLKVLDPNGRLEKLPRRWRQSRQLGPKRALANHLTDLNCKSTQPGTTAD
jgi:hypothetical protein